MSSINDILTEWLSMECPHRQLPGEFFSSQQSDRLYGFYLCTPHHRYLAINMKNKKQIEAGDTKNVIAVTK